MDRDLIPAFVNLVMTACVFWVIVVVVLLIVFTLSRFLRQVWGQVLYGGGDDE